MLTIAKIAVAGAIAGALLEPGGTAEQIVALAAAVAAVVYLARTFRAACRRVADLVDTALHGWKKLEDLPSRQQLERIAEFAETSEGRLSNLEQQSRELTRQAGSNGEKLSALTRELDVAVREGERREPRARPPRPAV